MLQRRVLHLECQQSSTDPYSTARRRLVDGEPVVMLHYTDSNAAHITHIETAPARAHATALRSEHTSQACHASPQLGVERSDLSSVDGDLRMALHGTTLTSNQLFRDDAPVEEARTPQPEFAWQGNPEYSPGLPSALPHR